MPVVDRVAVHQMIASILTAGLDAAGITLIPPNDSPPHHDPDSAGDTPVTRWCKMHRADIRPASQGGSTADERIVAMTLSVGVSGGELDIDPHQLDQDTQTVLETLEDAFLAHSDTKHTINVFGADSDIESAGDHDAHAVGIVTITASARRAV